MKSIVFATHNRHKVEEVNQILNGHYLILSLADLSFEEDVPETQNTLEGNALQKMKYVHDRLKTDCFAEDTGLEVDALNGAPGVFTARYAGASRDPGANMDKVLQELGESDQRGAQFRTVVALWLDGQAHVFEGIVRGTIARQRMGEGGFGYDPVFIPDGYDTSFAQMDADAKNAISHRGIAIRKMVAFLTEDGGR